MRSGRMAFTLIELLVAIAIMGILARWFCSESEALAKPRAGLNAPQICGKLAWRYTAIMAHLVRFHPRSFGPQLGSR
jgi:prepilin-type N-terminal cleavage/methylation domain-containing protein